MAALGDERAGFHARLEPVIHELERRFGPGVVYRLARARPRLDAPALSTGSLTLDLATGIGGVPRGHLTAIAGPESCGKTSLAYQVLASAQADGGLAAFVDVGQSADPDQLRRCGVDLPALILAEPLDPVEAVELAAILADSAALDAVVMSRFPRSLRPALLAEAARRLGAAIGGTPTALVIVGPAPSASLSIHLRPLRLILAPGGDVAGLRVRVEIVKNRLARPHATAELDILAGGGTHRPSELFDLGCALGPVESLAGGFVYGRVHLGISRTRAIVHLARDPDLARELEAAVRARAAPDAQPASRCPSHAW